MSNDEERGSIFRSHADQKTSNAERSTSNAQFKAEAAGGTFNANSITKKLAEQIS
jgi:hypothetical protein